MKVDEAADIAMGCLIVSVIVAAVGVPVLFAVAKFGLIVAAITWLFSNSGCT